MSKTFKDSKFNKTTLTRGQSRVALRERAKLREMRDEAALRVGLPVRYLRHAAQLHLQLGE